MRRLLSDQGNENQPLSAQSPQGATASGGAVGFIEVRLNGAEGPGSLYVSTQVVIKGGSISARGGVSVATRLAVQKSQ